MKTVTGKTASHVAWLTLAVVLSVSPRRAAAADWSPFPQHPLLDPGCIVVGDGRCVAPGTVVMIIEGQTLQFKATATDKDTKTEGTTTTEVDDPDTDIVWSVTAEP